LASLNLVKEILTTIQIPDFDNTMKTRFVLILALVALPLAVVCNFPPTAGAADEKAIRDADAEWAKVAGAKDLDKTVSYYADDAIVLPPNEAMVTSKNGIRDLWKGFLDRLTTISWKTTRVEMAKSGEIGYAVGTYEATMKDGAKDKGKYCEVWKKQGDGKWKVVTDMFSSDSPAAAAASSRAPAPAEKSKDSGE
jgi:ketosteroid isomerase-like protein